LSLGRPPGRKFGHTEAQTGCSVMISRGRRQSRVDEIAKLEAKRRLRYKPGTSKVSFRTLWKPENLRNACYMDGRRVASLSRSRGLSHSHHIA
jgi:hypothetical protein